MATWYAPDLTEQEWRTLQLIGSLTWEGGAGLEPIGSGRAEKPRKTKRGGGDDGKLAFTTEET